MQQTDREHPLWDAPNQRFRSADRCPYPDCGQPVDPLNSVATLAWCPSCNRPYEAVRFDPESGPPIELFRRPQTAFCPQTGRLLSGFSLLDWCEAGGEPGRSHCPIDTRGAIFGPPDPQVEVSLTAGWAQATMLARSDPEDWVSSVLVVRGKVVATTARGRIGIFDAVSGEPMLERPLEWPDGTTDPTEPGRNLRSTPAFRGTHMVAVAAHQARFRDLRRFLFGTDVDARSRLVEPDPGMSFLGPPLGVDLGEDSWFCLLQGRPNPAGIEMPLLRFFTLDGEQVRRCPLDGIARPPIFDQPGRCLLTIDRKGIVSTFAAEELRAERPTPILSLPDPLLELETDERPSFVAVRDDRQRTALWVSSQIGGNTSLFHCTLEEFRHQPQASWTWEKRDLGKLGPFSGFAVGVGSRFRNNAAGQLLAVSTTQQAALLQRFSASQSVFPMQGLDFGGSRGSFDPPIVCGAGVIARLQGKLCLDNQGMGWKSDQLHPDSKIPGIYDHAQGIAMFGRQVFIGHGLGVRSYNIELGVKP